jgi:signal transduction histidine kinase
MVWKWLRRHPWIVDSAIVVGLAAIFVGRAVHLDRFPGGVLLAVASLLPLLMRRRYPLAVLVLVSAAWIATAAVYSWEPPIAPAVALYTLVARDGRVRSLPAGAVLGAVAIIVSVAAESWGHLAVSVLLLGGAFVLGDNHATRRGELESERARAVAEEQARIGRELHDVIAHNVSVMVIQAAAANDVFDTRPDRAREALHAIEATGRAALGELRTLLGSAGGDEAGFAPQPGLERLDELVDQVRSAGLAVAVRVEGAPRVVPSGIDLSAYRIVQEALTNTLKHARATRADVAVLYRDEELGVEVRDDGTGDGNGGGAGRGLVGMRERVATFGGSLTAGPAPGGGYAVAARFPLGAQS